MKYEWQECTIGDLGQIVTGKTPPTKNNEYWGGKVMFITPKDIQATKHIFKTERYVTGEGKVAVRGAILPKGSICVSCIGNIGYLGITTEECISNQQINSIIVNENNDIDFVYYLLKSLWAYFKNYEGQSTALSILNKTQFSKIKVQIPNIEVQKKIAGVLKMLDEKIELNTAINNNLEQQAQAIFSNEFLTLETLPEGWKQASLIDIADYLNGLAMQKYRPTADETGIPVLKIKELRQGCCDDNSELCSPSIKSEYIIHDGDVIFSWSGSLLVDFWCGGICGLNQHLFKVTSNKYNKWFYYAWTKHHLDRFIAVAADKATTMGHIKRDELSKAEVLIPNEADYKRIETLLQPIYDLIIANRIENKKLAETRDTLLPKLMSGELDVSDIDL